MGVTSNTGQEHRMDVTQLQPRNLFASARAAGCRTSASIGYKRVVNEFYVVARNTVDEVFTVKRDKKAVIQTETMAFAKVKTQRG